MTSFMRRGIQRIPNGNQPFIQDLAFWHFSGEDDLTNIANIMNASYFADGINERINAEELQNIFSHPVNWDPKNDSVLIEVDGTLVGYGNTEWRRDDNGDILHFIKIFLDAEWRGKGLEKELQSHLEQCARNTAVVMRDNACHWFVSNVPDTWYGYVDKLSNCGYAPGWFYYEMKRSLNDCLPEVVFPTGLELRPALPEHFRSIWEAGEECFRDQRDHVAPSEESFLSWINTPGLDPGLWAVVWDGDQVAGAAINVIHQGIWGETDDLFVRRPWRKRGLGYALLSSTLQIFKSRGLATAGLGVDTENGSGALGLYEKLGYQPYQRVVSYRKKMEPLTLENKNDN